MEKKKMPKLLTDEDAEKFLEQDLSPYLHSGNLVKVNFEFEPKDENINLRVSSDLLAAVKAKAKIAKMPYQRYIRFVLEKDLRPEA